jgi:DNA polymerase elongation subunit (family B)
VPGVRGFIVSAWDERARRRFFATGRLCDGRSFAAVMRAPSPAVYVAPGTPVPDGVIDPHPWFTFAGRPLVRVTLPHGRIPRDIPVHHVDEARASDVLLGLGIRGPVEIQGGTTTAGKRVDIVFIDPVLAPSTEVPPLRWLTLDDATTLEDIRMQDPDVITGEHVLDQLAALARRCKEQRVPFDIGRVPGNVEVVTRRNGRLAIDIPGRAVVDADRSSGLEDLTVRRAALTGVSLDLAWTSIPPFERVYGAALPARNIVPPPRTDRTIDAGGGTVLDAQAGLFSNVLVFDFRSLYPSLMRTFNIDPLAHARSGRDDDIMAPNGARFARSEGILPAILAAYAREREMALAAGDETAAYVYKILQNSFYGVLGTSSCRYGRSEIASAITSFGKYFLTTARDWFEARGYPVIYGDTDSVFVRADESSLPLATRLADDLNRYLTADIRASYDLDSHLLIRCDKIYRRFFISRLRGDSSADGRGRGKGYAGIRDDNGELEVRGMEAVRSDFTPLARRFQRELMTLLFADADVAALRAYCATTSMRLQRGELDRELVYRKVLRRSVEEYGSNTPQVRAARLLGWRDRGGPIEYVMTRDGAEPVLARTTAALDYDHYRDRQLLPIAQAIANVLGTDAEGWLGSEQLALSLG